jgi:hypothetical protein
MGNEGVAEMKQVVKETIKYMWRSEKNRLFMGLTTALVLLYTLFVVPNLSSEHEINIEDMELEMMGNVVQFEEALDAGLIVPSSLTGTTAYSSLRQDYVAQREVLTALKQGDVRRYIATTYRPEADGSEEAGVEQIAAGLFGYDLEQPFQPAKNRAYLASNENLSFHTVHDRTSLQQVHLFLLGFGPILLLLGLIFLISDVHVKDRTLETQKVGHPLKWQTYTWVQAITALAFVVIFYLALAGVFILLNGLLHGFGTLELPIGYYNAFYERGVENLANFQIQSIGWFFIRALPYLVLLGYLFARINTLLSLWTKQSVVTMAIGMFILLFQFVYYGSEATELLGIDITNFPQTYFDFGKIITGRFEYQVGEAFPNLFTHGLLVLLVTIILIEAFIYLSSKKITRQEFVS